MCIAGCSNTKFLSEGQALLVKHKVVFQKPDTISDSRSITSGLLNTAYQRPNEKMLGVARVRLALHNRTKNAKKGPLKSLHDKGSEPPVILDSLLNEQSVNAMTDYLFDKGYFSAQVHYEVTLDSARGKAKRKARLTYHVLRGPLTMIDSVIYDIHDRRMSRVAQQGIEKSSLKANKPYDADDLRRERNRIANIMQNEGYRLFANQYVFFEADTIGKKNAVTIYVQITPPDGDSMHRVYYINDILLYPDYTSTPRTLDTIRFDDVTIIHSGLRYKPQSLVNAIQFRKGTLYLKDKHLLTVRKLSDLDVIQFVNVKFINERDTGIHRVCDVRIELFPSETRTVSIEATANSASDQFKGIGTEVKVVFKNRNLFRYTDVFTANVSGGIETHIDSTGIFINTVDFNADVSVIFPKWVLPFPYYPRTGRFNPKTRIAARYTYLKRFGFYDFQSVLLTYGIEHQETITNRYVGSLQALFSGLIRQEEAFALILAERPILRKSFQDVSIFGPNLSFIYTNQPRPDRKTKDIIYLRITGDLGVPMKLFGITFSPFAKLDWEIKDMRPVGRRGSIVGRFTSGAGTPLGPDAVMPYVKQFVIGGPNSIRAWRVRSLGPGGYISDTDEATSLFDDQTGDVKIEANLELRFDLIAWLKGAIFLDAGNIWLVKPNEELPGGEFRFDRFVKQVAVGTGFGFRFDFDFFIIRLDIGMRLRHPVDRWLDDGVHFLQRSWRRENLNLNLGIGYPF